MTARMLARRLEVVDRVTAIRWRPSPPFPLTWRVLTAAERVVAKRLVTRIMAVSSHGLTIRELELAACLRSRLEGRRGEPCDVEGCEDAIGDAQTG